MPDEPEHGGEPTQMEQYLIYCRMRDAASRLTGEYAKRDRLGDRDAMPALLAMRRRILQIDPSDVDAQRAATQEVTQEWARLRSERGA